MLQRKAISYERSDDEIVLPFAESEYFVLTGAPIISAGDVCGYIMFLANDRDARSELHDKKLIEAAAAFLGIQLE